MNVNYFYFLIDSCSFIQYHIRTKMMTYERFGHAIRPQLDTKSES